MIVIVNLERTSRGRMRRADESRDSLAASFEVRPRRISAAYVMDQRAAIRCGEEMLDFLASKSPRQRIKANSSERSQLDCA